MKRTIFFLVFGMLVLSAQAKIWRVNNTPSVSADFSDINTAISTAIAGDTLYVEGSANQYTTGISLNKPLCFIGPGYFLANNDSTLYVKSPAIFSTITLLSSSAGSIFKGLTASFIVRANNILIERNNLGQILFDQDPNVNNVVISKNYIGGVVGCSTSSNKVSNITINNNIIKSGIYLMGQCTITNNCVGSSYFGGSQHSIVAYSSVITNNICTLAINSSSIKWGTTDPNNSISNNKEQLGDNFPAQFIGGAIEDKYYMLKPTSSAKGAGAGGIDCGAFGGSDPYVLSGLPAIPHIYDVVSPTSGSATSGLAVKVKVKTQK